MSEFTEDERRALIWLGDEDPVQQNVRDHRDGSRKVVGESDISGGQAAMVRLLNDCSTPLHPEIRRALAGAIDHLGDSVLQLKKRAWRRPGRPGKDSIADEVRRVYEVMVMPDKIKEAEKEEAKYAPISAVGEPQKKPSKKKIISRVSKGEKMSRTAVYNALMPSNSLKNKDK